MRRSERKRDTSVYMPLVDHTSYTANTVFAVNAVQFGPATSEPCFEFVMVLKAANIALTALILLWEMWIGSWRIRTQAHPVRKSSSTLANNMSARASFFPDA